MAHARQYEQARGTAHARGYTWGWQGLDELKAKLDAFPKIAIPYVNTAIKNSIYMILRQTTPKIPVNTGRLARSFPIGINFSSLYGEMGTNVEYAKAVHDLYSVGTPYRNPSKNKSAVAFRGCWCQGV